MQDKRPASDGYSKDRVGSDPGEPEAGAFSEEDPVAADLRLLNERSWKRGEPGHIGKRDQSLVKAVSHLIKEKKQREVLEALSNWEAADVVELLIHLPLKRARKLYDLLPVSRAVSILSIIDPRLRAVLMEESAVNRVRQLVDRLDEDDAARLLSALPPPMAQAVVRDQPGAENLRQRLSYGEDTAGEIMSHLLVAVPESWTLGEAISEVRARSNRIAKLYEVYVVDSRGCVKGYLKVRDLVLHPKNAMAGDIMRKDLISVPPTMDQEEVVRVADKHGLTSIPVAGENGRVLGRITTEELRQIVRDEAIEDINLMSGLAADAEVNASLPSMVRQRLPWLLAGLVGASAAALVVGGFEEALKEAAILATFIPIVMAMAGNAGIQASSITVQGLASGSLWLGDVFPRLLKELLTGLINGAVIGGLLALFIIVLSSFLYIPDAMSLAVTASVALLLVIIIATVFGSTIPLMLHAMKIDPAVATGVFITTTNDIFGVLIFFVLATALYL